MRRGFFRLPSEFPLVPLPVRLPALTPKFAGHLEAHSLEWRLRAADQDRHSRQRTAVSDDLGSG